jgi:hypothetical protein
MKKGRAGTVTHDYKRHGTTTLFAASELLAVLVHSLGHFQMMLQGLQCFAWPSPLASDRRRPSHNARTVTPLPYAR